MLRREFLKKVAVGGITLGIGTSLAGCRGVVRDDFAESGDEYSDVSIEKDEALILYYASLAPSGHNSQPWFVKIIEPKKWIVGLDPLRRLSVVDPMNREGLLAIGAFVENLSIAAGVMGYQTEINVIAKTAMDENLVAVDLKKGTTIDYPLRRLKERRTIRDGLLQETIKKEDLHKLSYGIQEHLFYFPKGSEHARCIEQGAVEQFRNQSRNPEAQKELSEWMRLKNAEASQKKDGLTTASMGISGLAGLYVRTFINKEDILEESFINKGIDKVARQASEGGGWLILTSEGHSVLDLINTGRRFERMVLSARDLKIGIHPMTQILEEKEGRDIVAREHDQTMIPQFILRVGYVPDYPAPVSLRRPVRWFIKST